MHNMRGPLPLPPLLPPPSATPGASCVLFGVHLVPLL